MLIFVSNQRKEVLNCVPLKNILAIWSPKDFKVQRLFQFTSIFVHIKFKADQISGIFKPALSYQK